MSAFDRKVKREKANNPKNLALHRGKPLGAGEMLI